mmetsp:Transcript_43424/g.93021  ORF Transcript_43424/g.93021 Transcript_43424/m.93021 type:complete len:268 (+) Transcript_43424:1616-2419(+)
MHDAAGLKVAHGVYHLPVEDLASGLLNPSTVTFSNAVRDGLVELPTSAQLHDYPQVIGLLEDFEDPDDVRVLDASQYRPLLLETRTSCCCFLSAAMCGCHFCLALPRRTSSEGKTLRSHAPWNLSGKFAELRLFREVKRHHLHGRVAHGLEDVAIRPFAKHLIDPVVIVKASPRVRGEDPAPGELEVGQRVAAFAAVAAGAIGLEVVDGDADLFDATSMISVAPTFCSEVREGTCRQATACLLLLGTGYLVVGDSLPHDRTILKVTI